MAKALPDRFPPAEKRYSLYEDIEYRGYWEDPNLTRQDALEQHLVSSMLPTSGRRIIDLGCGYGRLAPCYLDRFEQVVLCDGSLSLLRDARETLGDRALLVAADITRLPFKDSAFDCVLTIRVLQHLADLQDALKETRRIMSGGGSLIFSYHNKTNPSRILRYVASRSAGNPFSLEPFEVRPTLISRHPKQVAEFLSAADFSAPEYKGALVVNSLAAITGRFGRRAPAGAGWAPLTGRFRLAPWLIGQSLAQGTDDFAAGDSIDELFECPLCRGTLRRTGTGYRCAACGRDYPVTDGIADFRPYEDARHD